MSDPSKTLKISVRGVEQTIAFGREIGRRLQDGLVIALVGHLGAGKTHLVKGIALGNGLPDADAVTSPTFVLVNEYPGRLRLYHLDLYRLKDARELAGLGFEEMAHTGAAVVVEWADRFADAMPPDALWIRLVVGSDDQERILTLDAGEGTGRRVLEALKDISSTSPSGKQECSPE